VIERGLSAYRNDNEAGIAALHRLLERQHYQLAYWRVAFSAVNYRRFFDISDLAGLRVEDPKTFRGIHPLVARLISDDQLQGLRLDHIDGLRDPAQYTRRLKQMTSKLRREAGLSGPFYVVVEKILGEHHGIRMAQRHLTRACGWRRPRRAGAHLARFHR
jgi:(1->4)-alpha-D-glucan 1-alpha-D-glucosylmutase